MDERTEHDEMEGMREGAPAGSTESAPRDQEPAAVIPTFLTREEYEQIGDDPEPLPQGFEVIEGGAGLTDQAASPAPAALAEPPVAAEGEAAESLTDADADEGAEAKPMQAMGAFISEGMGAVREVSAAKRAHASAREVLEQLEQTIRAEEAELAHRRDITERFDDILRDESARRGEALARAERAVAEQAAVREAIAGLKQELQDMRDGDAQVEKRLKAGVDAAEAKEASSRESSARLKRRLDDATRALEKARQEKDTALEAAQAAIEGAAARLTTLRDEYAEVQRNPSANSAAYSVRTSELQIEISDAAEELRCAQDAFPLIKSEVETSVATAEAMLAEAQKPIEAARRSHKDVTAEADEARDALDRARTDAEKRQRALRDRISEQERELKAREREEADARSEADEAQERIDEATEIHDHPEEIESLEIDLERNRAEAGEQADEVEELAEHMRSVRDRTRASRLRFIGFVAVILAVIAIAVIAWLALS